MPQADIQIILVSFILFTSLLLLVSGKISVDRTAIGIMVVLSLTGILTPGEVVSGFANPAVLTVGAMFILSYGLIHTGAVGFATALVLRLSKGRKAFAHIIILFTVAVASAFINNTPVVVLFIPIVMGLSCDCDFSPSKLLIPLSYVSILGGTCTLIGTSTNIIVSDLSAVYGFESLSMFELGKIGVPIALVGVIFLLIVSPKLMPGRTAPVCELDDAKTKKYIAELIVPEKSSVIGKTDIIDYAFDSFGLDVVEVFRNQSIFDPARTPLTLMQDDTLLVKGSAEDLVSALKTREFDLAHGEEDMVFGSGLKDDLIVELIVTPSSALLSEPLLSTDLNDDSDIQIIAIRSRTSYYSYRKIKSVRLEIGDIILVRCPRHKLEKLRKSSDFMTIEDIHHTIINKEKAGMAIGIFAVVVLAATFGLADIMVCSITGVFLMTMTQCLNLKDAYRSLQPDVLLLIIGTIALGLAMQKTGATKLYADFFLSAFKGMSPNYVLLGIILLASICTHILSNNATAVLLLPIAISTAVSLGVNPKPFIVGICFGASACFATPIGYQTNLLVYSPGGYRFSDYIKLGLPLNLLVILCAAIFIPMVWPL
ncbi:MAG: SLC13 family permease [Proteobacteria bacterium]|nr:SLC13 family permease [Pseudomonadota bacterium]MBU1389961.1 SLC13 family permease [Pseudomonadota bacterium]MBU1544175.1 SLC13 family permease [Pseudomonadota bacterium]MBU2481158.1 SLC13 family permease [Pseudomonadota bacterium]